MFKKLFGLHRPQEQAHVLYGAVVARARDAAFFEHFDVPDTFDGRFEMLIVHLFMLHARLKDENEEARAVSQLVFDAFIDDMDAALREAGVGDQTVPKRINKMTRVFYGRTGAFEEALAKDEPLDDLRLIVARNLYTDEEPEGRDTALAQYIWAEWKHLSARSREEVLTGKTVFNRPFQQFTREGEL